MGTQQTSESEWSASRSIVLRKYGLNIMKPVSITNYPVGASAEDLSGWTNMTLRTLISHEYPVNDSQLRRQIIQSAWAKVPGEMESGLLRLHRTISLELAKLIRENSIIQTDDRFYEPSAATNPFTVVRGKQANEISVIELMTVLNALYYHNPDTCRALLFDEAKSLYGLDYGNHLLDVNLGLAHSLLLHHGMIEEDFETSTCSCAEYDDDPTRFLRALPLILQDDALVAKRMEPSRKPVKEYPSRSDSESDSKNDVKTMLEEPSPETPDPELPIATSNENGHELLYTDLIDPESIPRREPTQSRQEWVSENITRLVRSEFPLQFGLLRQQLVRAMIQDGLHEAAVDAYLHWATRFMKETISFHDGFFFPSDFTEQEYHVVRGRSIEQICVPEIALVMHRLAAERTATTRTDLFSETASVLGLDPTAIDVQAAMEKALKLLKDTGRIYQETDESPVGPR